MWQMLVVAALGVMSAFGGFLGGSMYSPVHDGGSAKTLEVEHEGYVQQINDGSGTRSMVGTDGTEAAPQAQTATEEERPLIDVSRHQAATETQTQQKDSGSGNVSVLTE